MSQEVKVFTWCDPCTADDPNAATPAETHHVVVDGTDKTMDLCEMHDKAILGPVREVLEAHGNRPVVSDRMTRAEWEARGRPSTVTPRRKGVKTYSRAYPCMACDTVWSADSSYRAHLQAEHGWTAGVAAAGGKVCPVCNESGTKRGWLIRHARHPHGVTTIPLLFAMAKEAGDPHGVVAARVAAITKPTRRRR